MLVFIQKKTMYFILMSKVVLHVEIQSVMVGIQSLMVEIQSVILQICTNLTRFALLTRVV